MSTHFKENRESDILILNHQHIMDMNSYLYLQKNFFCLETLQVVIDLK